MSDKKDAKRKRFLRRMYAKHGESLYEYFSTHSLPAGCDPGECVEEVFNSYYNYLERHNGAVVIRDERKYLGRIATTARSNAYRRAKRNKVDNFQDVQELPNNSTLEDVEKMIDEDENLLMQKALVEYLKRPLTEDVVWFLKLYRGEGDVSLEEMADIRGMSVSRVKYRMRQTGRQIRRDLLRIRLKWELERRRR